MARTKAPIIQQTTPPETMTRLTTTQITTAVFSLSLISGLARYMTHFLIDFINTVRDIQAYERAAATKIYPPPFEYPIVVKVDVRLERAVMVVVPLFYIAHWVLEPPGRGASGRRALLSVLRMAEVAALMWVVGFVVRSMSLGAAERVWRMRDGMV